MKPVLELRNVTKTYCKTGVPVHALKKANLKINKNEYMSIMGPSGSGKSTMLHMIGCLDRPTTGKILINGNDISKLDDNQVAKIRRTTIGFIFQFFNLIPNFTAKKNVELPMIFSKKSGREKRAQELLEAVGLGHRLDHYPSQMSGGEIQRVSIARAMANDPDIILADEPTGNLDSKSGAEILDILKRLNKERGVTVVMVTHDKKTALQTKRLIYLKDGEIIKRGVKR
ncbi:MAG: ABC transporter ATP-binding protein [Candidatus Aenigmarchaeota archaeon]|nr:ABC transporter ATP-binding protein [Candidatus Aenigmarchaeota archaeon]